MADSLKDLLGQRDLSKPAEIVAIEKFLRDEYQTAGKISVRQNQIVIAVPSAAMAGTLRLRLPQLQKAVDTTKRLIIRIG